MVELLIMLRQKIQDSCKCRWNDSVAFDIMKTANRESDTKTCRGGGWFDAASDSREGLTPYYEARRLLKGATRTHHLSRCTHTLIKLGRHIWTKCSKKGKLDYFWCCCITKNISFQAEVCKQRIQWGENSRKPNGMDRTCGRSYVFLGTESFCFIFYLLVNLTNMLLLFNHMLTGALATAIAKCYATQFSFYSVISSSSLRTLLR